MSIRWIVAHETRLFAPIRHRLRDSSIPRSCFRIHVLRFQSGAASNVAKFPGEAVIATSGHSTALKDISAAHGATQELSVKEKTGGDVQDNDTIDEDSKDGVSVGPAVLHLGMGELEGDLASVSRIGYGQAWQFSFDSIFHMDEYTRKAAERSTLRAAQRGSALSFAAGRSPEEIRKLWDAMERRIQNRRLPFILIGCLSISARLTLRVLKALPPFPHNFHIRMDCLLYLRRAKDRWSDILAKKEIYEDFQAQLAELWSSTDWPPFAVSKSHVGVMLDEAPYHKGCKFVERYLEYYSHPQSDVLLAIVDHFTRKKDIDRALATMRRVAQEDLTRSDQDLLQRCTNLLKLDIVETNGDAKNFKILPQLLELGVKPDVIIYTITIQNAIAAGMSSVAWDLYRYMQSENLETNGVTHLLLLKDAFAREDVDGLNEILSAVQARQDLFQNPYIVAHTMNIVRIINVHEKRSSPSDTWAHVLSVYGRAFNLNILSRLGMVQASSSADSVSASLPPPPPNLLATTIFEYVLVQTERHIVDGLWAWLVHLLREGDEEILAASKFDIFYNGFVFFYGRSPYTLKQCPKVVHYMLDNDQCQPTPRTWSLLLCAFVKQGQHEAAEQIRQTMLKRGMEPNSPAFNFLIEKWPQFEVAVRAKKAFEAYTANSCHYEDHYKDVTSIQDEELFAGVRVPGKIVRLEDGASSVSDEDTPWKRMIDLRLDNLK